jgi:hypothetical protein
MGVVGQALRKRDDLRLRIVVELESGSHASVDQDFGKFFLRHPRNLNLREVAAD